MTTHEAILLGVSGSRSVFDPQGCEACRGTGYKGRLALAEILVFNQELDELLITTSSRVPLKALVQKKGFIPLAQDGRHRVLQGDTSIEEVLRIVDLREEQ
jgi:type II secretory ATPase GspE/PulE/Tfp pilus assembly ATPase PilB-like protein